MYVYICEPHYMCMYMYINIFNISMLHNIMQMSVSIRTFFFRAGTVSKKGCLGDKYFFSFF
jgi:hypothetical protein